MDNLNAAYVDFNHDWSYPLQWLFESSFARWDYQRWLWRVTLAQHGKPCKNTYQEELKSNLIKAGKKEDSKEYKDTCQNVPEGRSFALRKAADNIAAQMSGGVDTYEYQAHDPFMILDPDTNDLLAARCEQDYVENGLNNLAPVLSNDIFWRGMAAVVVKYDPKTDRNRVLRVNPKNCWWDTKYSSTGEERFRGYSTMISWKKLKKMVEDDGDEVNLTIKAPDGSPIREEGEGKNKKALIDKTAKYANRKIRSLNGLDIYVDTLNKLAASPSLPPGLTEFYEYDHDLHTCYNLGWYQSFATNPEKKTNNGYGGDDVELTVIYDLRKKIEFKIINRRYVISANQKAFKKKIHFTWTDPRTRLPRSRMDDFCLDCPLKFQMEMSNGMDTAPHPWSIVFDLLDSHDELCGWRARREHVSKILSILRIETNGADASSLRGILNIMGVVIDDIQGDINSINFDYAYDPIDSEIAHLESQIQQVLHAYDQFDALQSMGDRASAAESGMAMYAVAQGLSVHQNALMQLYADIARQCIANRVAYSSRSEFPVDSHGLSSAITVQQMALDAIVNVKPKLAKKIQEKTSAANAMALLGQMGKPINISADGAAYLMEQAMMGQMPRGLARQFVRDAGPSEQELALAEQQAQNDAMALAQNQRMYEENPMPYEAENVLQTQEPEVIDEAITMLNAGNSGQSFTEEAEMMPLDMQSQDGATDLALAGMTPETGGEYANPNARGEI